MSCQIVVFNLALKFRLKRPQLKIGIQKVFFFSLIHLHFSSFIIMFGSLKLVSVDLRNDLEACLVNGFWFDLSLHNRSKPGDLQESYRTVLREIHVSYLQPVIL